MFTIVSGAKLVASPTLLLWQAGGAGNFLFQLLPIFLIFGVFYFLIVLPQRKQKQALQQLVSNLKAGDRVITSGGMIATITAVRDSSLLVRTADKSMIEITRAAVIGLHGADDEAGRRLFSRTP